MLDQASEKLRDLVRSDAGQSGLSRFFADSKPLVLDFIALVSDAVKGLGGIGARLAPELRPVIAQLRTELLPALLDIVDSVDGDFLSTLVTLATQVTNFVGAFMVATPTLKVFLGVLGDLADAATFLLTELGPVSFAIAQLSTALGVAGVAAAGFKLTRMISEFAGARAGATLLAGSLGTAGVAGAAATAATSATVATGAFGRLRAALAFGAGRAVPYVAGLLVAKNVFDSMAPSVDKTVAAIQRAGGSVREVETELKRLADPGFWQKFAIGASKAMSTELVTGLKPLESQAKRIRDSFVKLAQETPDLAFKSIGAFTAASGKPIQDFTAILSRMGLFQDYLSSSTDLLTTRTDTWATATQAAGTEVEGLRTKLDGLLSPTRAQEAALIGVAEGLDNLSASLTLNGTSLDVNTEKGRANLRAIDDVVGGIQSHIEALIANGATQDEVRGAFNRHIEDFKNVLRQMGLNEAEIDSLIEKYGLVPETVETAVKLTGAEEAKRKVQSLVADLVAEFGLAQDAAEISVRVFGAEQARASVAAIKADTGDITKSLDSARPPDYEEGFDGRSAGGPVRKGFRYLVGEMRPELFEPSGGGRPWVVGAKGPGFFVPPVSGRIIPRLPPMQKLGTGSSLAGLSGLAGALQSHAADLTRQLPPLESSFARPAAVQPASGYAGPTADEIAGAVASAVARALSGTGGRVDRDIVLQINGREFARATAMDISAEQANIRTSRRRR